jgi:hypothetical protein
LRCSNDTTESNLGKRIELGSSLLLCCLVLRITTLSLWRWLLLVLGMLLMRIRLLWRWWLLLLLLLLVQILLLLRWWLLLLLLVEWRLLLLLVATGVILVELLLCLPRLRRSLYLLCVWIARLMWSLPRKLLWWLNVLSWRLL